MFLKSVFNAFNNFFNCFVMDEYSLVLGLTPCIIVNPIKQKFGVKIKL